MIRFRQGFALMILVISGCAPQVDVEADAADYVFENINVVPMNEETVLLNQAVAVRENKIVTIVDQSSADNIQATTRIDGAGRFLMPGLADMHMHIRMDPQAAFNLLLANGVTTIANMGLADGHGKIDHLQLRADVAAGRMDGPRYLVSGPQLTAEELPTVADVEPMLDDHVEQGYDVVKVHGDLSIDVYDALIEGARERGLRVTGHSQHQMPLSQSLRMDSIEHIEEFVYVSRDGFGEIAADFFEFMPTYYSHVEQMADPEFRALIVRDVAASGVYIDATLIIYKMISIWIDDDQFAKLHDDELLAYLPKSTLDRWLHSETNPYRNRVPGFPLSVEHLEANIEIFSALIFELHEAGVPLLLGTDSFGTLVPGFSIHRELEMMVAAGLTPYEALRAGTVNAAAYLDEIDTAGTIEVGKRADFILVEENPLTDIRHVSNVQGVFKQGKWHSAIALARMLAEAKLLSASTD